jgi:hypothetical protein
MPLIDRDLGLPVHASRPPGINPEADHIALIVRADPATDVHPSTPDGRYFVVRGRLWRKSNPALTDGERERFVKALMDARRKLRGKRPPQDRAKAKAAVDAAKRSLGERGPVWWTDGSPDYNRRMARNTPYADWYERVDTKTSR